MKLHNLSISGIFLIFIYLLCSIGFLKSQSLEDMRFDFLDESDGLSNHLISKIVQDSNGFLWISTMDGLNRYDGYSIKVFRNDKNDSSSIQNNSNPSLAVSRKGQLWLGYNDGGLSKYQINCHCFENFYASKDDTTKLPKIRTRLLHLDTMDNLWFSDDKIGLYCFNPQNKKLLHYQLPDIESKSIKNDQTISHTINNIYEAPDGLFWLTTTNGLYSFNRKTEKFNFYPDQSLDPKITRLDLLFKILPDHNKGLWLSSWSGGIKYFDFRPSLFSSYKFNENKFTHSFSNLVRDLIQKDEDEIWVATGDKGLGIFNTITKQFHFVSNIKLLEGSTNINAANMLLETSENVLIVLIENGLLKYDPKTSLFRFIKLPDKYNQNNNLLVIIKIIEDPENDDIYFATGFGSGLNILNKKTGKLEFLEVELEQNNRFNYMFISDLLYDRNGKLWVLTNNFIYSYNKQNRKLQKIINPWIDSNPPKPFAFKMMSEDKDGDIWVLTRQGGLYQFNPSSGKLSIQFNSDITDSNVPVKIHSMNYGRDGLIWLISLNEIFTYNKLTKKFARIQNPEIPNSFKQDLRFIQTDSFGNIWVVSRIKGILKLELNSNNEYCARLITNNNGIAFNLIMDMSIDFQGNLWCTTPNGIIYMNTHSEQFRIFNHTSGMDKNYFSSSLIQSNNNAFYISSKGSYCRVNFTELNKNLPEPKIYIDKFKIYNKEQNFDFSGKNPIVLKPGDGFFSFDFSCIDFSNQSHHQFAYMLEGWDHDWIHCGNRRYASYTNLNGGDYTFKVKVANHEGQWGNPISIPVIIKTPFYKKSWFALLSGLFAGTIIYSLYIYRIRQIEKAERIKTEFNQQLTETRMQALRAQMNPHFIFNCLNSINRYIIKSDVKTSSLYLTKFAKLIRLILDNSEHKKVTLSNELEALHLYIEMESLRFDHKFEFNIEVDQHVDTDYVEVPPLIIQPFVENAIWHGLLHKESGGKLEIKISQNDDTLICEITDNGIGRKKAMEYKQNSTYTRKSLGLKLTEERLHFATDDLSKFRAPEIIDLFDENGQACGTTVLLTIPI